MKLIFTLIVFTLTFFNINGQELYVQTFGKTTDQAVLFLHGGPGYNSANFEATTAQELANNGFFVIVYDRRGEGRSVDAKAKFNFKETFDDLNSLYKKYGIQKAILIGHSFGGTIAVLFAEAYPKQVSSVYLVGAPISFQATFKSIIKRVKTVYALRKDTVNLSYIEKLEKMDPKSIEYSSYCFLHAMQNGFYSTKSPTEEAKELYKTFRTKTSMLKLASDMTSIPPQGFWENEHYTSLDLTKNVASLMKKKLPIYGLYGKDDGLFLEEQIDDLRDLIGEDHVKYLEHCSHSVFIDQQTVFIASLKKWIE